MNYMYEQTTYVNCEVHAVAHVHTHPYRDTDSQAHLHHSFYIQVAALILIIACIYIEYY